MSDFNISDKELKALLKSDGLDEPSMSFNRKILEKAQAIHQPQIFKVSVWIKVFFALILIVPMIYALIAGSDIGTEISFLEKISKPDLSLGFGLNATYQYILLLSIAVIWMAFIFNRFLNQQDQSKVKKG